MNLEKLILNYIIRCEIQNNLDSKTLKAYKIDLNQFNKFIDNKNDVFSKQTILDYICELKNKKFAIKTIKRKIASLRAFFSYLNYEEIIEFNPFQKIKLKIKEPFILPKTIPINYISMLFNHLYEEIKKCDNNSFRYKELVRDIAILELLMGTGMRISEVCTIKTENFSFSRNTIKICGKGAKERIIPIYYPRLISALEKYRNLLDKELRQSTYFFINKRKNKISTQSVRNMINKYCNSANIPFKITPHMFRHTFATMLLDQNVDSRYIQILLGHSNILTTQIYTHVTSNKKKEIMKYKSPLSKIKINKG